MTSMSAELGYITVTPNKNELITWYTYYNNYGQPVWRSVYLFTGHLHIIFSFQPNTGEGNLQIHIAKLHRAFAIDSCQQKD